MKIKRWRTESEALTYITCIQKEYRETGRLYSEIISENFSELKMCNCKIKVVLSRIHFFLRNPSIHIL